MKRILTLSTLSIAILGGTQQAQATCSSEPYIGSICYTAATFCPRNYAETNGDIIPINSNQALFALLGCQFGGDCRTTFALPDLRGRTPVHTGTGLGLTPVQMGQKRGLESVSLQISEMPNHSHTAKFTPLEGANNAPSVSIKVGTNSSSSNTTPSQGSYLTASPSSGKESADIYSSQPGPTVELGGVTITGGGSSMGGIVNVDPTGGNQPHENIPPQLGLRACIAMEGIFPPRN